MISLSNIFTRERSLFYAFMWNDSDRMGYERWLGHRVRHNLFQFEADTGRLRVWYDDQELAEISTKLETLLVDRPEAFLEMTQTLDKHWPSLVSAASGTHVPVSMQEVSVFYDHLIAWWSAMNLIFLIPDLSRVPETVKTEALRRRIEGERFSDLFERVFITFWTSHYPDFAHIARVISPREAFTVDERGPDEAFLKAITQRVLEGCVLFDEVIYVGSTHLAAMQQAGVGFAEFDSQDVKEIKGNIACPGIVKGIVRVVLFKKDIGLIQEGEILVSTMTTPDFLPGIKKCAAIVTNEGGITCHAAIVSRELGKPCIIGTKSATKVLKDGDMVEVDADKGIVRLIK